MSIQSEVVAIEHELSKLTLTQLAELRAAGEGIAAGARMFGSAFNEESQQRIAEAAMAIGQSAAGLVQLGHDPKAALFAAVAGCPRLNAVVGDLLRSLPLGK